MTDTYTSSIPLVCPVEIKRGGNTEEADLQLAVWLYGSHSHLSTLRVTATPTLPIQCGWIVMGHQWKFRLSWMDEETGGVHVYGPWPRNQDLGTGGWYALLALLEVLRRMIEYFATGYWQGFEQIVRGVVEGS